MHGACPWCSWSTRSSASSHRAKPRRRSVSLVARQDTKDDEDGPGWVPPKTDPPGSDPETILWWIDVGQLNDIAGTGSRKPLPRYDDSSCYLSIELPQVLASTRGPRDAPTHQRPSSLFTSSWETSCPSRASRRASVRPPSKSSSSGSPSGAAASSDRSTGSAVRLRASRTRAAVGSSAPVAHPPICVVLAVLPWLLRASRSYHTLIPLSGAGRFGRPFGSIAGTSEI